MTIAAGLLASDGVVLASDSTTTFFNNQGLVTGLLTGGQKIFQLGMNRPYGFVLFGAASFGTRSYRDLLSQFDAALGDEKPDVPQLAQKFYDFAVSEWAKEATAIGADKSVLPGTGFLVGGTSKAAPRCTLSKIAFRTNSESPVNVQHFNHPGTFQYEGCPNPANRLVYGIDSAIWQKLCKYIPSAQQQQAWNELMQPDPFRAAPSPALPLRGAIDYLHWIVHATIKYYKFVEGVQICGGKVELACITSDRGFRWITHKSLDWTVGDCEGQTEYCPADPHGHGR
jgi:hypothetical protein